MEKLDGRGLMKRGRLSRLLSAFERAIYIFIHSVILRGSQNLVARDFSIFDSRYNFSTLVDTNDELGYKFDTTHYSGGIHSVGNTNSQLGSKYYRLTFRMEPVCRLGTER